MIIAYDLRYASDHFPGIGTHAYRLLEHLLALEGPERYVVLWAPGQSATRFDIEEVLRHPRVTRCETAGGPLGLAVPFSTGSWLRRLRPAVFFSPFSLQPVAPGVPCVLTLHDVLPLRVPGAVPARGRLLFWLLLEHARGARRIVTSSDFSRSEIVAATHLSPARVRVVRPGVPHDPGGEGAQRPAALPDGPFALVVSINKPHKNLATLEAAWRLLDASAPIRLVQVGPLDGRYPVPGARARQAAVSALGRVAEAELEWLYRHATLVLVPSLYEGFGFPLLEAMAYGTAAVVSDIPPLRELGGDAVRYVAPLDVEAWASTVQGFVADLAARERLARAGSERASQFTYARTAVEILALLREVAAEAGP